MNRLTKRHYWVSSIFIVFLCVGILILSGSACCQKKVVKDTDVRLVLMVVVDQLRGDIISRLESRLGDGGFRYLRNKGTWFKNARYDYATTITAVGHATLFTGANPAQHGIVGNNWYDRQSQQVEKPVEISVPGGQPKLGPYQLNSTTIGDELVMAFNRRSRVFSVSFKDRSAILPAGKLGKAFWYGKDDAHPEKSDFITGEYYYKKNQIPHWLVEWKNSNAVDQYLNQEWNLLQPIDTYIYNNQDSSFNDALVAKIQKELSSKFSSKDFHSILKYMENRGKFPHKIWNYIDKREYYQQLSVTPYMDELTMKFASFILEKERLGQQNGITDMLTVSFSALDSIGHCYGPDSLEYEDSVLRIDQILAQLFKSIDEKVGLDRTMIVVVGDHGVDSVPEYINLMGIPSGRIVPENDFKEVINRALQEKYRISELQAKFKQEVSGNLYIGFWNPSIYLDEKMIAALQLNIEEVERTAAEALMKQKYIGLAITRTDLWRGNVMDTPMLNNLKNVFHPKRSGNILIIQEPNWYLYHDLSAAAMHGSPFHYDTHVPLFVLGPKILPRVVYRLVCPRDIAMTIALKLGISAPPFASGIGLQEVFQ